MVCSDLTRMERKPGAYFTGRVDPILAKQVQSFSGDLGEPGLISFVK